MNAPGDDIANSAVNLREPDCAKGTLTCVDLFAGAGGFSLAAKNAGFKVVAAVEINPWACKTYARNLVDRQEPALYQCDISELKASELKSKHFSNGAVCDVLLGGPPCQGFSVHRINNSGVDDPRNRLLLRYFEFVRELQPKLFLMENVPGLLWPRHYDFLSGFYKQATDSGYRVHDALVLDARDYGVPQRRKRVFVLGTRKDIELDILWPPLPTHCESNLKGEQSNGLAWLDASTVFNKTLPAADENSVHMNHTDALIEVFRRTPINGGSRRDSGRTLPCHDKHDGHKDVYGRIDPTKPGPTMTTACINPSKGRFVHPTENHGITVRQAARFQTFPDDFVFKGGLIAAGVQIGNAVPIVLAEILLKSIRQALLGSKV